MLVDRERNLAVTRKNALASLGEAPPFDGPTIRRLSATNQDRGSALWNSVIGFIANSDEDTGWRQLVTALDHAPDDDLICYLGVAIVEAFIDEHPLYVLDHLDDVRNSRNFRASLTCVNLSDDLPPEVEAALEAVMPEDGSPDDIGHQPGGG